MSAANGALPGGPTSDLLDVVLGEISTVVQRIDRADIRRMAHEAIAKKLTSQAKLSAFASRHRGERGAPAIRLVAGEAFAASPREVAEVRWVRPAELDGLVPGGVYPPVRGWLEAQLSG